MCDGTIDRTVSLEETLVFKLQLINCPTCQRCHSVDERKTDTVYVTMEILADLRLNFLGLHFMKPSGYQIPHEAKYWMSFEMWDCERDAEYTYITVSHSACSCVNPLYPNLI
jgi:hypothetical protein